MRGDTAGKAVVVRDAVAEEEALVSEQASVDALVLAARADAEKMAEAAVSAEVTDRPPKVTRRDDVDHLATEATATLKVAAAETTTKEEEVAEAAMAAEELTSTARDQEETDREVAEEEAHVAVAQDPEAREVPELEPLLPSEHPSPGVR